ncbi:MAG: pitrilysin family protein [Ignavibacteriaceae bacterium]|jgi:zinc protease|nr:pitrilysin family protein [Ignavibacteriaceae bacterium]
MLKNYFLVLLSIILIHQNISAQTEFKLEFEKYTLKNGLDVILHIDRSDPIAAVAIQYHVGSNREVTGKTGFAHLFEHIMFQESQHVGQDQFFKLIQGNGGTLNGGTWKDGTIYFEVVPNSALELALWLEADRMGFMLPTVTYDAFLNQQQVVQNEKRQNYDNRPYGQSSYIIGKLLYPDGHPYNWTTIGSLEDLQNATLKDVHNFYTKWYGPNNATLVVSGDFDVEQTKNWIEKYFGEITSSAPVEPLKPMLIKLNDFKKAYYEDNFAQSPELTMIFPAVENYSDDSYALNVLADLIGRGKKSPLYKLLVEEKKLAPSFYVFDNGEEIAGDFRIVVRTYPNKNLTEVEKTILEGFEKFEKDGFTEKDLERTKAGIETQFYNSISSVLGKSYQLATYNVFKGTPGYLNTDLNKMLSITSEDVWRVYNKYIKDQKYVLLSIVPKGKSELAAENSELFVIPDDNIKTFTEEEQSALRNKPENLVKVDKLISSFDRSQMPANGPDALLKQQNIWKWDLDNGIKILGIKQNELPLVDFQISISGGMLLDNPDKVGTANLVARMLTQGTKTKTPLELEQAIEDLGANISVSASNDEINIRANCLSYKFAETFGLVEEILFEPRWDKKEFDRLKNEVIESINRSKTSASATAANVFSLLIYGKDNILSNNTVGNEESVQSITIQDLMKYYDTAFDPQNANICVAGDVSKESAIDKFTSLESRWKKKGTVVKLPDKYNSYQSSKLYFIDFPGARQSEIRIGALGMPFTDPDYFKATVMNYKLGGSFNGFVNLILREEKGYTYGARTGFSGYEYPGYFVASAGVQTNATLESVEIFRDEMLKYRNGISDEDLKFTKESLIKSNALKFETIGALRRMLSEIVKYDLPFNYIKLQEKQIEEMTFDEHKMLAEKYINPDKMIYLIAGDKETQFEQLKKLGLGEPILLDKNGNEIKE